VFVSENVINAESETAMTAALLYKTAEGKPDAGKTQTTLRSDSSDPEEIKLFETLAGTDNNYSYLNMVRYHPRYDNMKVQEIRIGHDAAGQNPSMALVMTKQE